MILTAVADKLLLDVVSVPDVSGAVPFIVLIVLGCGIALVAGVIILLYFIVFKNRKKK